MGKSNWRMGEVLACGCIMKVRKDGKPGVKVYPIAGCSLHPVPPAPVDDGDYGNYYDNYVDGNGW